jgi:RecJ-like exonuclease
MLSRRLSLAFLTLTLGVSTTACNTNPAEVFSGLDPTPATKISDLVLRAEGSAVVVQGKVVAIAPLIRQSLYEVQDPSGSVWVLTNRRAPQRHAPVKVHGRVRSSNGERYIEQK